MNDVLIQFCASFLIYFLYLGLLVLWVIDGKIKKEQVVHSIFAGILALLISNLIKLIFPTLRPFMQNGLDTLVFITPMNGSFPSEHTVAAFAVAVTVFMHNKKYGSLYLIAALLIGYSRVLANVHYPIDIIAGAFIGTLTAVIIEKVHFLKLFKN